MDPFTAIALLTAVAFKALTGKSGTTSAGAPDSYDSERKRYIPSGPNTEYVHGHGNGGEAQWAGH